MIWIIWKWLKENLWAGLDVDGSDQDSILSVHVSNSDQLNQHNWPIFYYLKIHKLRGATLN